MTLKELLALRKSSFTAEQEDLITKAYFFAEAAHKGQKRKSGEDYFEHSKEAAAILIRMGLGAVTASSALLHDVPEDTPVTLKEIKKEFGGEVAFIVEGITKLSRVRLYGNADEYYLNNLRKMFLSMAADIRVVLIKLADRLHNMRTLDALPPEKQKRIAKETMEVYAPIANRLGIGEIKGQLEDLAFKYLDRQNYEMTVKLENEAYNERKKYVERAIKELKTELKKEGIQVVDIHGRAKHYYRMYEKLRKNEMDINKVFDLTAIRIILPSVATCYEALGIVHKQYRPLIGRIKDYISLPKPNGYKSLHTTVFGPEGKILEIQIRTERMHDEAEFGIAAHWIYSSNKSWKEYIFKREGPYQVPEQDLHWVKQLREWYTETGGMGDDFWEAIKIDFFQNHIFAFTPIGDVIELPENSTPIDFAYRIHSELGNRATGVKINGKMVSLDYVIRNGDRVEIITTKDKKLPSRDWLNFVKTTGAKAHIKSALRKAGIHVL